MKALPTNTLVNHPSYPKIISTYNELLKRDGKVNNRKFYREVVAPEIPDYAEQTWYSFLKKFKTNVGIVAAVIAERGGKTAGELASNDLTHTMLSNNEATINAINGILNLGASRIKEILENPQLMTAKEVMDLFLKAMKAQDSRIHAVGKIREDNREQERFDRAFDGANYGD